LQACGIAPIVPQITPRCHIVGVMAFYTQHEAALRAMPYPLKLQRLAEQAVVIASFFEHDIATWNSEFEEPICNIACQGSTRAEAQSKLLAVLRTLGTEICL